MKKNPYDVLGIGRRADQREIKRAYRRAAKKSHPDLASAGPVKRRFCEIQEAYETLKDHQRRRRCDEALDRMEAAAGDASWRTEKTDVPPRPPAGQRAEPLIPSAGVRGLRRFGPGRLALEIVLSPSEAQTGGRFPLHIEMEADCAGCGNSSPRVFFCRDCGGIGRVLQPVTLMLDLPPGIRDGARATAPIDIRGRRAGVLDLFFRIDPLSQ